MQLANLLQTVKSPAFFNYVIMALYLTSAVRWGVSGRWTDMCYWLSAFAITATVTFGYKH